MKKTSQKIAYSVLFAANIVLFLSACVMPVDTSAFLNDDRVQQITQGEPGAVVVISPLDPLPELTANRGTWTQVGGYRMLTVSTSGLPVTVTVTNASVYNGGISWYCNNINLGTLSSISVQLGTGPFVAGVTTYIVTVRGNKGGVLHSTMFYVTISS